ncbi:zinc-binding alcohol dehydrogenase family protein [Paenibacillus sp. S-38]|uniref:zinc-binding alcohol dehydrogenase family protein n=1 Tax=Paenibacillus sp. S-38 TaxID=3416710 RepID=UPI003CF9164A
MSAQDQMKAVGLYRYLPVEHPEALLDVVVEKPVPGEGELLIRVMAVSVNPVDTKVRAPKDRIESSPRVLGWDAAGIVEAVGPGCTLFRAGDEVYYAGSIARQGSNAEFQTVDERIVGRKPQGLSFAEAAALPLTAITAWEGLFERLRLPAEAGAASGRTVLIIGAAGGVGSIAVQLARWAGLTVIGTASRSESQDWVRSLGAHHVIDHHGNMAEQLELLGIETVESIFCLNSTASHWEQMARIVAPQGSICSIVETDVPLNLTLLKNKSASFVWEFMFTRPMYATEDRIEQHRLLNRTAELLDAGVLRTTLTKKLQGLSAATIREAHTLLESGSVIGKVVVEAD